MPARGLDFRCGKTGGPSLTTEQLPEITDEQMTDRLGKTREYTLV
jgi:hypothetical protein